MPFLPRSFVFSTPRHTLKPHQASAPPPEQRQAYYIVFGNRGSRRNIVPNSVSYWCCVSYLVSYCVLPTEKNLRVKDECQESRSHLILLQSLDVAHPAMAENGGSSSKNPGIYEEPVPVSRLSHSSTAGSLARHTKHRRTWRGRP